MKNIGIPVYVVLIFIPIFLHTCSPPSLKSSYYIKLSGATQGTSYHITYESPDSINYQDEIEELLHKFNMSLSAYEPASLISSINRDSENVVVDKYFEEVFMASKELYEESNGAFDITIAPVVNAWGFGFTERADVDSAMIDSLLQYVGMDMIELKDGHIRKKKKGIMLDVNAIAQGYAVDVVADFLEMKGLNNYLVEIGGEVRTKGRNSRGLDWRVGIDKPIEGLQIPGVQLEAVIGLTNLSLATSGNYRRFYEKDGVKYSHTINPKTGFPVNHNLLSATVLANDCMIADGYATAFMILGLEESKKILEKKEELEAYLIYNDQEGNYKIYVTNGMKRRIIK